MEPFLKEGFHTSQELSKNVKDELLEIKHQSLLCFFKSFNARIQHLSN